MKIGERIKAFRISKGMTQTELADILQTTKQNVFKYENGIVTNIPSDRIEKMAEIFGVEPAELMGWSENTSKTLKFKPDVTNAIKLTDHEIMVAIAYRCHPAEQKAVDRILEITDADENMQKKYLLLAGQGGSAEIEVKDPQGASEALKKLQTKHKK